MSKFSLFMKENKKIKENEKYAPTESLKDKDGNPMEWEFRPVSTRENENLRDACTKEVQVIGKPHLYRPKMDTARYMSELIAAATVFPDLLDAELQNSYGVKTPEELIYALVDDAGEYQELNAWMQKYQGFTKSLEDKVDEAKN